MIEYDGACEAVEEALINVQREMFRAKIPAGIGSVNVETMGALVGSGAFRPGGLTHGGGSAVLLTPLGALVLVTDDTAERATLTVRSATGEVVARAALSA